MVCLINNYFSFDQVKNHFSNFGGLNKNYKQNINSEFYFWPTVL